MPTVYEKSYGSVKFYEPDGTPIFDTEDDLGLWTSVDEEPSPEPKWVRVSVPGADGAVDLSRALAGQVTYERREIALQFVGKCASHAAALALVHQMRRALHGARVRVETVLTAQVGGYYIADCECDGVALTSGEVTVDVTATADPFIRIGNQSLELPATVGYSDNALTVQTAPVGYDLSTSSYTMLLFGQDGGTTCPIDARAMRLWWAMGENLFDPSAWPYVANPQRGQYGNTWGNTWAWLDGQRIRIWSGDSTSTGHIQLKASDRLGDWPAWPYSFPFSCFADWSAIPIVSAGQKLVAYVSGNVTAVGSSPSVKLTAIAEGTGTDADGFVSGLTTSQSFTPSVGSVSQTLVIDLASATWSGAGARAVSAIDVELKNTTGSLTVCLAIVVGTAPASWDAASLGWVSVNVPSPMGWYHNTSDNVQLSPYGATESCCVVHDGEGTSTGLTTITTYDAVASALMPDDIAYYAASVEQDGGTSGACYLWDTHPVPSAATGTNTTMRSTPSVTTSGGATITIDGRTAIVGPGTVALPALVIPGGTFTVDYALFGSNPTDATLTWEGGAL